MKLWKKIIIAVGFVIVLTASSVFYFVFIANLPINSGTVPLSGLIRSVRIEKDKFGVPKIFGSSRADVAMATGFIHAQERFFQMDLLRRNAAGELSELFGKQALEFDKERRIHRFRSLSRKIKNNLPLEEKNVLEAYTEGVNQGICNLKSKPFEYFLLGVKTSPWVCEDSILVGLSLYLDLQEPYGESIVLKGVMRESLPKNIYEYLIDLYSEWNTPLNHTPKTQVSIPNADSFSYLKDSTSNIPNSLNTNFSSVNKGSNQWAVHPSKAQNNHAILSCDMHLNLSVPNIFYRLNIRYLDTNNREVNVNGVGIPGTPIIVVGSNGKISWGFTNSYVDTVNLVVLENDDNHADLISYVEEIIKIKGEKPFSYFVEISDWGPISNKKYLGSKVAIDWVAHSPDCFNFSLINFENIINAQDAIAFSHHIKLPAQNLMVVDVQGNIGWTIIGDVIHRESDDLGLPRTLRDIKNGMKTSRESLKRNPYLLNPKEGFLWTANNNAYDDASLVGAFLNPIRAYQIHYKLTQFSPHSIYDSCKLQLDEEAIFFKRWHKLILSSLDLTILNQKLLYSIVSKWDETCSNHSHGYFWIREFRERISKLLIKKILAPCLIKQPDLNWGLIDFEEPIYQILKNKPAYLEDLLVGNWTNEISKTIDSMIDENIEILQNNNSWGDLNFSMIKHPFSWSMPFLSSFLDMPKLPISGDYYVPRVASSTEGASVRMVVSPGNEKESKISLPCGQSGHPLSKHYKDHHMYWAKGEYLPFKFGKSISILNLVPKK